MWLCQEGGGSVAVWTRGNLSGVWGEGEEVPSVQGDCDRKEQGGCGFDELWHSVWCEGVVGD